MRRGQMNVSIPRRANAKMMRAPASLLAHKRHRTIVSQRCNSVARNPKAGQPMNNGRSNNRMLSQRSPRTIPQASRMKYDQRSVAVQREAIRLLRFVIRREVIRLEVTRSGIRRGVFNRRASSNAGTGKSARFARAPSPLFTLPL
jgi:hypothetical protein